MKPQFVALPSAVLLISATLLITILPTTVQASSKQSDQLAEQFNSFVSNLFPKPQHQHHQKSKHHNLKQDNPQEQQTEEADSGSTYKGFEPVIGRNLLSVLITDIMNIVYAPGWVSLMSFFVDTGNFLVTPMLGGIVNASVFVNYEKDPLTYQHAGLDKNYLYGSSMLFAKDYIYSAMGRPDFYDTGEKYVTPTETDETNTFPQA